jgi:hypothetical protein
MAIYLDDSPYNLTPRGQKLLFVVLSTNVVQDGFKYGVKVTDLTTSQEYQFYYSPNFADGKLYFDLSPLVNMRNFEGVNDIHSGLYTGDYVDTFQEPQGSGWKGYAVNFTEWWLVDGVLTKNPTVGFTEFRYVFNAYYQPSDGYKPNLSTGLQNVKFALNDAISYLWSDRKTNTYVWPFASTYTPLIQANAVYIPAFLNDYGMINLCPRPQLMAVNQATSYKVDFYDGVNPTPITTVLPLQQVSQIEGIRIYPGNLQLNAQGLPVPSDYPEWTHYILTILKADGNQCSAPYVFFNAEKFGLKDCRFDLVRLAWVGSRQGWEYQNFTKKNEDNYTIERRQFRQVLPNNYISSSRQLTDRQSIVDKIITINSDWLQEGEFQYLKGLLVSNQVHIVNADGTQTPVNVAESTYIARRERLGKKYNLTLKIAYSQDYWS